MDPHAPDLPELTSVPETRICLLGGTHMNDAAYDLLPLRGWFVLETPAGASPRFWYGEEEGVPFIYSHFHGECRWVETWAALYRMGVKEVLTGATAGGINPLLKVGDYVIPDDFIDLNYDRPPTVPASALGTSSIPAFPRMAPSLDPLLSEIVLEETRRAVRARPEMHDVNILPKGTVMQSRGPRFETVAEVQFHRRIGADLVTMNVGTEIVYARQLGIHIGCLNLISNPAEGLGEWGWETLKSVFRRFNGVSVEIMRACLPRVAGIDPEAPRAGDGQLDHPSLSYKD